MAGQGRNDGLALFAQAANRSPQFGRLAPGRKDRARRWRRRRRRHQRLEVDQAEANRRAIATESRTHLVVSAPTSQRTQGGPGLASAVDGEAGAAVVGIPAHVGEIKADLQPRVGHSQVTGHPAQICQRLTHQRALRQDFIGGGQHFVPTIEAQKSRQGRPGLGTRRRGDGGKSGSILLGQRLGQVLKGLRVQRHASQHAAQHTCIGQVDDQRHHTDRPKAIQRQFGRLEIGLQARVAEDLGPELQGLSGRGSIGRSSVQHRAAVAQAHDAVAVEQMRIDARCLRCRVGADPQTASAQLVDELEGPEVEFAAGSGEQSIQMLYQRRNHELETVGPGSVEKRATDRLKVARFVRQHIGHMLRQQPGRTHWNVRGG